MPIDLGEIYSKITVDKTAMTAALQKARAEFQKFGVDIGSSLKSEDDAIKRQNGSIQQWKAQQEQAAKAVQQTTEQVKQQTKAVSEATAAYTNQLRMASALRQVAGEMAIAGTAITGAMVATIKTGADFSRTLQTIQANTGITNAQLKQMQANVEQLGTSYGGNMAKIAAGEMHAINLFHDMAAAQAITVAGAKAAVATGGDEEQVINGLAKSLKEWNVPASQAANYMNGLFFAANRANTTLPEMMQHTDRVRAAFANLNLPLSQMLALYATLTQHGLNASQAETQLFNVTQKIIQPTKQAADMIAMLSDKVDPGLSKAFSITGLQTIGFAGIFDRLRQDAQKLGVPISELVEKVFPNLRGVLAALIFSGTGVSDLRKNLEQFQGAFGRQTELNTAVKNSQEQLNVQIEKLRNHFVVMAAQVTRDMAPALINLMGSVKDLFSAFEKLSPATRTFLEWTTLAGGAALLLGSRVVGLAATFYQLRAAVLAAQAAGNAGPITGLLAKLLGGGASGIASGIGGAAVVGATGSMLYGAGRTSLNPLENPADTANLVSGYGSLGGPGFGAAYARIGERLRADSGRVHAAVVDIKQIAAKNVDELNQIQALIQQGGQPVAVQQKLIMDRQAKLAWLKANNFAIPAGFEGAASIVSGATDQDKSAGDMLKQWKADQKAQAKALKDAQREAKQDARDGARDAEQTAQSIKDAVDKLYEATHGEWQNKRHAILKEVNDMARDNVPQKIRQAFLSAELKRVMDEEKKHYDEIKAEGMKNAFDAVIEENNRKAEALKRSLDLEEKSLERLEKLHDRLYGDLLDESRGLVYKTPEELEKGFDLAHQARALSGFKLGDLATGREIPEMKPIDMFGGGSVLGRPEETGFIFRQALKAKMPPTQEQIEEAKHRMREYTRELKGIFEGLFTDLLDGHKNIFRSIEQSFKKLLIDMAAQAAAQSVVKGLGGLFAGLFGGGGGKGGGGSVVGTILGGITGILGFDSGGWVPGPIGAPQLAVVHGGEFVQSRDMLASGGAAIAVHFHGDNHFHNDYDVDRLIDRISWRTTHRLAVNPGS